MHRYAKSPYIDPNNVPAGMALEYHWQQQLFRHARQKGWVPPTHSN